MAEERFGYRDVEEAWERIRGILSPTPLEQAYYLGGSGRRYYFKLESLQRVRSFKIRGALSKMLTLTDAEKERGVGTVSSGNHGIAVSCAASQLGIRNAAVIVQAATPQSKVEKIEYFGAKALRLGRDYDEAHALGMAYIEENGLTYIDPYNDDPKVYGGQGTVAVEILRQDPEIDTIVVPVGGGALVTGIAVAAKAIRPGIRVIGVQTGACPAMIRSLRDRVFYAEYPSAPSLCDALIGGVGALSYSLADKVVDDFIEVPETSIGRAVSFMAKKEKFIAEAGSCTTVAAVADFADRIGGRNVALVISGGNIDGKVLLDLMNRY